MPAPLLCPPALLQIDLSGATYLVTGGNSGIGWETALQLAKQGARVAIASRDVELAKRAVAPYQGKDIAGRFEIRQLDLADLDSVRRFADEFRAEHRQLTGLVNNAGVMNTPKQRTKNGFELQFGVNHLGHFLLTELLLDTLRASAPSRIVNVSSCYHDKAMGREGHIQLDDLQFERRKYDGWTAYAQSKLANVLYAKDLAKRLAGTGVTAVSVHPGWVRTKLIRHSMPVWLQDTLLAPFLRLAGMIEPWEGAQSTLFALLSPEVVQHPGEFFSQVGLYRDRAANAGGWPLRSPNPEAHNDELAAELARASRALVGLPQAPA